MAIKLIQPGNNFLVEKQFTKAVQLLNAGDSVGASNLLQANLKANPRHYESLYLHGLISAQNSQWNIAVEFFSKALQIKNNDASIYNNLGNVLFEKKSYDESVKSFEKAIELKRDYAQAYFNLGRVLSELKKWDEAFNNFEKAIELNYNYSEAFYSRGVVEFELRRLYEALGSYEKAIQLKVDYPEAHLNRGLVLHELGRLNEAIVCYEQAIELKCDLHDAYINRGRVQLGFKKWEESILSFSRSIEIVPDHDFISGIILHIKMIQCDWKNFKVELDQLISKINLNKKVVPIFDLLALTDLPTVQKKASEIWVKDKYPINPLLGLIPKVIPKEKIRIGYFSPDFRAHPVAQWVAELFELHDKTQFELIGLYFGPKTDDEYHVRILSAFDKFIDVSDMSDIDIAKLSRSIQIDIAVDLAGFTNNSRTGIFAYRAAPIQINYIGYPATTGANYMDYIIADEMIIPTQSQQYYSEKIIYLPYTFKATDTKLKVSEKAFTREEFNLPVNSFVFCCFNNSFKILPETFDVWMRILKSAENSVLWLADTNSTAKANLKKEAEVRGISPSRIIFSNTMVELADHFARLRLADLFLDTFTFNAHTTAGDALWSGLPLLTFKGRSFASRVASSLLNAVELPELIARDVEQYESIAIELAKNPEKLRLIKSKLQRNIKTTPLFNMTNFTKYLETAYKQIHKSYQADLKIDHVYVKV